MQKIYGLLLGPKSCKVINFASGKQRKHFTGSVFILLEVYELFVARSQNFRGYNHKNFPFFELLTGEVIAQIIPERVQRNNPRVVKKPVSKFLSKQVKHRGTGIIMNPAVFIVLSTA